MAFSNSNPLLTIFMFSLLLINNVSSQSYYFPSRFQSPSPSLSPSPKPSPPLPGRFSFPFFQTQDYSVISVRGDASIAGGALSLTGRDNLGNPIENSIGRAQYRTPVQLWDKATGNLADFTAGFTFLVNPKGSTLHGDGFAFFLAPVDSTIPTNSEGGYLGLFNPQNALNNTNCNQIVAIEFDTYHNEWDPVSTVYEDNHVGININSIRSVVSAQFPELDDGKVSVSINYDGESKYLGVSVSSITYPNRSVLISHFIDLRNVLPEWVRVGFSATTGQLVETHEIFTWYFDADF